MQRRHFEAFRPICPHCARTRERAVALRLASELRASATDVEEGLLECSDPACQLEYPIIDGIPIIVPDVRTLLAEQFGAVQARTDLSADIESLLGDALGQGSEFDSRRQHLSIYAWDGYAEFIVGGEAQAGGSGGTLRCLEAGAGLLDGLEGPVLDLGCSVGRSTFELAARTGSLTLGVDLSFNMLRFAQTLRLRGSARFPRRRVGVVYDQCTVEAQLEGAGLVDFWLCDAMTLPLAPSSFRTVTALNLLDCVPSPLGLLQTVAACLQPGGQALLASPFDWAANATPMEAWIGGHSQRGGSRGEPVDLLRRLLEPGAHPQSVPSLEIVGEIDGMPWDTRLHDRSTMRYQTHVVALRKRGDHAAGSEASQA